MASAAVSAGNEITAQAGAEILRSGGNAVDALIAAGLTAFMSEPLLASAGGAGMMTVALPGEEPVVLDFFSRAPGLGAQPETPHFERVEIDFGSAIQAFHVGRGSVAAPLALPGLAAAAERFGSLPLSDLIGPARRLALQGFTVEAETAHVFELLWPIMARDADAVALYGAEGQPPPAGHTLCNPDFARVLDAFAQSGGLPDEVREGLLQGFGKNRGGMLSPQDIDTVSPSWRSPHRVDCHDCEMLTSPHPGGHLVGVITQELLRIADQSVRWADLYPTESITKEVLWMAHAARKGHAARAGLTSRGSTTQLSVMDAQGGAASMTLTNGEGSGHLIGETGIQANNFLGEEDLNPHGFHQHQPGAALPTMLAPTILRREGVPILALGSGGANRIRSAVSNVIFRYLKGGATNDGRGDLDRAVRMYRVHAETDTVWFESPWSAADPDENVIGALRAEFKNVCPFPGANFFFGGVHAVERRADGTLFGVGDARRGGCAILVE